MQAADFPDLGPDQYMLHFGLRKAESSMLTQARTGKIGLRAFLFERNVPTVRTPVCPCGLGEETVRHLIADCSQLDDARQHLRHRYRTGRDVRQALSTPEHAHHLVRWLLRIGRLSEYRVALEIEGDNTERSWARATDHRTEGDPPPTRRRGRGRRLRL